MYAARCSTSGAASAWRMARRWSPARASPGASPRTATTAPASCSSPTSTRACRWRGTRARAILAGDNSSQLRLTLLQSVAGVQRGDRIITSGHGGSFPVGIPIGEVVATGEGGVRVKPYADFARLEFVRVVDYGVTGLVGGGPTSSGTPGPAGTPAPGQRIRRWG